MVAVPNVHVDHGRAGRLALLSRPDELLESRRQLGAVLLGGLGAGRRDGDQELFRRSHRHRLILPEDVRTARSGHTQPLEWPLPWTGSGVPRRYPCAPSALPAVRTALVCTLFVLSSASAVAAQDNQAPVLSNFTAAPGSLGPEGGTVTTITVDATDDIGVTAVGATVYFAKGGGAAGVPLVAADPGTPDTYSGMVEIPSNHTHEPVGHGVEVTATDTNGETTLELLGWIDVDGQPVFDQAPYVFDATLSATSLPSGGGTFTIGATATDDRSISEVYAVVTDNDGGATYVPLERTSSDRFESPWTARQTQGYLRRSTR